MLKMLQVICSKIQYITHSPKSQIKTSDKNRFFGTNRREVKNDEKMKATFIFQRMCSQRTHKIELLIN